MPYDRKVRARFYQVHNVNEGEPTFFHTLERLWNHPERQEYTEISGGMRVRIERLNETPEGDGMYEGEFVRQQTDNIPPVAADGGVLRPQRDPLGHRAAFRYWPEMSVVLFEARRGAVSVSAVNGLVKRRLNNHKGFVFDPTLSRSALERLRGGTPRRIVFRVARPADMQIVEGEEHEIEENLARLQNLFNGPNVEVTVSWPRGNREGVLSRRSIRRVVDWAIGHRNNVEKMQVKVAEEEEAIDVLAESLAPTEVLTLDNEDVELHYQERQDFLARSFDAHREIIRDIYRP